MLQRLNIRTIACIVGLLLILVIWSSISQKKTASGNFNSRPTASIDTSVITEVRVWPQYVFPERYNRFIRTDSLWVIEHDLNVYPIRQDMVNDMLTALSRIRTSRVISHSTNDWGRYGLEDVVGTRVQVYAGERMLLDFRLGGLSMGERSGSEDIIRMYGFDPDNLNTYMRIEGDSTAYLADGFFSYHFTRIWDLWIDSTAMQRPEWADR